MVASMMPMTREITDAPVSPIRRCTKVAIRSKARVIMRTRTSNAAVVAYSAKVLELFSVSMTMANIAPGDAIEGIASGKTAPDR